MNGRVPEEIIEAVLKRHDIVDIVGRHVQLTKQGRNFKGLCPFHSEKSPSFTVNPEKQMYKCFGCGAAGGILTFLRDAEGITFVEAVKQLAEEAQIATSWDAATPEQTKLQSERARLMEAYALSVKLYHYILKNTHEGKAAMTYLVSRGFDHELLETYQIGYAPAKRDTLAKQLAKRDFRMSEMESGGLIIASGGSEYLDRFRERIMFPIMDARGRTIALAGRALGDQQPKYLNSPETVIFHKSEHLFNLHLARPEIRKEQNVIIFEGYADVMKAWQAGFRNGVATMGTSLTEQHAATIRRQAETAILCYDGDPAGQTAAYKCLPILEQTGCHVKIAVIPDRLDPDDYISTFGADRFRREVLDSAHTATSFRLLYLRRNTNLQSEDGRLLYIKKSLNIVSSLTSHVEREHYLKELSAEFQTSLTTLKQDLYEILQKKQKIGDNNGNTWNNVMNDKQDHPSTPLYPAYHNAERGLLSIMLANKEAALYVQEKLGGQFNIEEHAALAAYLYAFYNLHEHSDIQTFISTLQDRNMERLASSLYIEENDMSDQQQIMDDYIREVLKFPQQQTIEIKVEDMVQAERRGDFMQAAQIANEIKTLRNQLRQG